MKRTKLIYCVIVHSEWLGNQNEPPSSIYFTEAKLQIWLRWTEMLEDALQAVRKSLRPYLCDLRKNVSGKIIGNQSQCNLQNTFEINILLISLKCRFLDCALVFMGESVLGPPCRCLILCVMKSAMTPPEPSGGDQNCSCATDVVYRVLSEARKGHSC